MIDKPILIKRGSGVQARYIITWKGKTQHLHKWAEELGITGGALKLRLDYGWDLERALTAPPTHPQDEKSKKERKDAKKHKEHSPAKIDCKKLANYWE